MIKIFNEHSISGLEEKLNSVEVETILNYTASGMMNHYGDGSVANQWTEYTAIVKIKE